MKRFVLAALLGMSLLAFGQVAAAKETDEQKFVRLTRAIETRPLSEGKDKDVAWLLVWAYKTKRYGVTVCPIGGDGWGAADELGSPLLIMALVGNMAWQIEHGGQAADELSKQHAGVLTALRIYENTVAKAPSRRTAYFDSLVARRDAGTLREFLAPSVAKACTPGVRAGVYSQDLARSDGDEGPFLGGFLQSTDILYPTKVGAWEWLGEHRFDDPEAGVSARYARKGDEGHWIDVYFYPVGTLDAAESARLAEMERDALREVNAAEMGALTTFDIPMPSHGAVTGRFVDFVSQREGKRFHSSMAIGVHRLYAVKVRYSVDAKVEAREQALATVQAFTRGLFAGLEIDSTGRCWSRDAKVDGCSAPKDELRAAPAGMRILHLEYAVPGEKATPSVPLGAAPGGVG